MNEKSDVIGTEIWKQIQEDPDFLIQPEKIRGTYKEVVEALPNVLGELLDQQLTLTNMIGAKVRFLRYILDPETGFIEKYALALPDENIGLMSREELPSTLREIMGGALEMLESMAGGILIMLEEQSIAQSDFLQTDKVGLGPKAIDLLRKGELTIGRLILVQPMVIINNR